MNIERKLLRWREAGLIDEPLRAKLLAFERGQQRPLGMYAAVGLGASTLGLGLVSIVAANWDRIPALVKLAVDLLLGVLLAFFTFRSFTRSLIHPAAGSPARETLVCLTYLYTLASLALVGQVYQLGTPTYQALLAWSLATLPLALLAESRFVALLYAAGLATTHALSFEALYDYLRASFSPRVGREIAVCATFLSPLSYVAWGRLPWLVRERPAHARSQAELGFAAILAGGFAVPFIWYSPVSAEETLSWSLLVCLVIALGFSASLPRLYPTPSPAARLPALALAPMAWLALASATAFPRDSADFVGALLQVLWLGLCAVVSYRVQLLRLFNLLTAAIAVRVLVIYFEVFGSLLDTGMGLLTGGALTLFIAWFWQRKTRQLTARASVRGPGGPHV